MDIIDTDRYPIDQPDSAEFRALCARCQADLETQGLFNLPGFLRPEAIERTLDWVKPVIARDAFVHKRAHNIYFKKEIPGLAPGHPALQELQTINHTICADQIEGSPITRLYDWPALASFLAHVMNKPAPCIMVTLKKEIFTASPVCKKQKSLLKRAYPLLLFPAYRIS